MTQLTNHKGLYVTHCWWLPAHTKELVSIVGDGYSQYFSGHHHQWSSNVFSSLKVENWGIYRTNLLYQFAKEISLFINWIKIRLYPNYFVGNMCSVCHFFRMRWVFRWQLLTTNLGQNLYTTFTVCKSLHNLFLSLLHQEYCVLFSAASCLRYFVILYRRALPLLKRRALGKLSSLYGLLFINW